MLVCEYSELEDQNLWEVGEGRGGEEKRNLRWSCAEFIEVRLFRAFALVGACYILHNGNSLILIRDCTPSCVVLPVMVIQRT